jgi:ABC-type phosphate/phosphonate transport system ATPase subunit
MEMKRENIGVSTVKTGSQVGKLIVMPVVDTVQFQSTSMVILIGLPGAGKSTFYRRVLRDRGFTRRDARSYDSRQAFILAVDEVVTQGIPVSSVSAHEVLMTLT